MGFLPDTYEPPQSGNYMKLQIGENRIRVLGSAIVGNEFWVTENDGGRRPVRRRMHEVIEAHELGVDQHGSKERPKHFWAFPVWNYKVNQVQVLEITQRGIQESIRALDEAQDWGDPKGYDILIRKSGSGLDTNYQVMPGRQSDIPTDAMREYLRLNVDMEALYEGGDPFASDGPATGTTNGQSQPPADNPKETTTATIQSVEEKTIPSSGRIAWIVRTDQGEFGTTAEEKGKQAGRLVGAAMKITWEPTDKGGKRIVSWDPAVEPVVAGVGEGPHEAIDEDDIPF